MTDSLLGVVLHTTGGDDGILDQLDIGVDVGRVYAEQYPDGVVGLELMEDDGDAEITLLATPDRLADLVVTIEPFLEEST